MKAPRFKRTKITISTMLVSSGKMVSSEISADVWSGLAVHEAIGTTLLDNRPVFSITHMVSGRRISPLFFETDRTAKLAVIAFAALPLDWESGDREQMQWPYLRDVILGISALCGGFHLDSALEQPAAGHA